VTILQRLRPHRTLGALASAMLAVVSVLGVTLGLAGTASATIPDGTPISYFAGGDVIGLLPGGNPMAILPNKASQPGQSWLFQLADPSVSSTTVIPGTTSLTWAQGDSINIPVFPFSGAAGLGTLNNVTTGNWVEFSNAPTVVCTGGGAGVTQPTFNVTLATNPNDTTADKSAGLTDLLQITFTDSATVGSSTEFNCAILNVNYTTGPAVATGPVAFENLGPVSAPCTFDQAVYEQGTLPAGTCPVDGSVAGEQALDVFPNAIVLNEVVSANTPPVSVLPNARSAAISPIVITELATGQVTTGYVCVSAGSGDFVITPTSPTITLSPSNVGGTASVSPAVNGVGTANADGGYTTIEFQVLTQSTTVPTTFTLAGLLVNAPGTVGPVTATVVQGASATCTGGTTLSTLQIYAVGQPTANTRIAGSNADQTAVAALEYEYPPTEGFCLDQGVHPNPSRFSTGSTVILATDQSWQDALTASYLASFYQTGVLLTPTDSLSPYTAMAIQQEGVNNVIIVGGTLAVSQAVQNQLASTPAYYCGGASIQTNALGQPVDLTVQRIAGATADGTAAAVATFVNSGFVGDLNISGSFGQYNDTLGTDSGSSPTIPVRTAILVTDGYFQDAASASSLSYDEHLPILLTPTASLGTDAETALLDLGIQQVIELGGPLAISNAVNTELQSQGISVLRIAGADGSETSVQLAKFELNRYGTDDGLAWGSCTGTQTNEFGVTYSTGCATVVALARGDYFADALTSSVVTGNNEEPIILAENPTTLGTYATAFFNQAGSPYGIDPDYVVKPLTPIPGSGTTVSSITVFGGPLAIANSTLQAALTAIAQG
jgi:putative cell wall-binding protein